MTITPPRIGDSIIARKMFEVLQETPVVFIPLTHSKHLVGTRTIARRAGKYLIVSRYPMDGKFVTRVELI